MLQFSSTPQNLYAIDTDSSSSKGQENKAKLNYHLSIHYAYFALFILKSSALCIGQESQVIVSCFTGEKNLPEYRTNDNGSDTVNSVLCSETQTKKYKVKLKLSKSTAAAANPRHAVSKA